MFTHTENSNAKKEAKPYKQKSLINCELVCMSSCTHMHACVHVCVINVIAGSSVTLRKQPG
jgi:hypothetical protein